MLPAASRRLRASTLIQHLIDRQWLGEAFEERRTERLIGKESTEELKGGGTDDQGIGRGDPLQAGRKVGRLAEGQLFLPRPTADLAHHHQPGVDAQAHGEVTPLAPAPGAY